MFELLCKIVEEAILMVTAGAGVFCVAMAVVFGRIERQIDAHPEDNNNVALRRIHDIVFVLLVISGVAMIMFGMLWFKGKGLWY